jgi:WD40 repeat protein
MKSLPLFVACCLSVAPPEIAIAQDPHSCTVLKGHRLGVKCLAFAPDGRTLASGGGDATARLWNTEIQSAGAVFKLSETDSIDNSVDSIDFSPDGKTLAAGYLDSRIRLWNIHSKTLWKNIEIHKSPVSAVRYSPDGRSLAAASDDGVRLWDPSKDGQDMTVVRCVGGAHSLAFSPTGALLAIGRHDDSVSLVNPNDPMSCKSLDGHAGSVFCVSFSPDGNVLASAGRNEYVALWDVRELKMTSRLFGHRATSYFDGTGPRPCGMIWCVAFSPDGRSLASGAEDKSIIIWDRRSGHSIAVLNGHNNRVTSLAFSRDGKLLASGSDDKTIRVWNYSEIVDNAKKNSRR